MTTELKPQPMSEGKIQELAQEHLRAFAQLGTGEIWFDGQLDFAHATIAARDAQWLALVGELQRDAARYRWARLRYDGEGSIDLAFVPDPYWGPKNGDDLDAAIDAARGEKGGV